MEITRELSIKDIAQIAKVSIGTVDRVIHNRTGVSKKTKEKILQIINELHYKPNVIASNLAKKKVFHFEIVFLDEVENSYYSKELLKGIEKAKNEMEHFSIKIEVKIIHLKMSTQMNDFIEKIEDKLVDGCIVIDKKSNQIQQFLNKNKIDQLPYVLIGEDLNDSVARCIIKTASYDCGKLAAQLFNTLFKEGSLLILSQKVSNCKKVKGLMDYLSAEKSQISIEKIEGITNIHSVVKTLDAILSSNPSIKGIFIPDFNVYEIAAYLKERSNLKIHLIGYDFIEENSIFLEEGIIDFLISQKITYQGFVAMQNLFRQSVLNIACPKHVCMPMDIITKQNYRFY